MTQPRLEIREVGRCRTVADDGRQFTVLILQAFRSNAAGWRHAVPGTKMARTLNGQDVTMKANSTFELFDVWSGRHVLLRTVRQTKPLQR